MWHLSVCTSGGPQEGQLDVLTVVELEGNPAHDRLDGQISSLCYRLKG